MTSISLARTLRLAVAGSSPRVSAHAREALLGCDDIAALAELAGAHRVAPWLAAAIATDPDLRNEPRFGPVKQAAAQQSFNTLKLYAELRAVLSELDQAGTSVVVLKGPVLAQSVYPDAGLRPYSDIDLLINEADLASVSALLSARGYFDKNETEAPERLHECHGIFQRIFINPDMGTVVEVHCDHLQIGVEPVSMHEIWARSVPARFGKSAARALEPHDLFVQLCVHLQRHGFERLIWFKDLDLMVRRGGLDWARVRSAAEEQDCLPSVAYSLWLLRGQLGTPLPDEALALSRSSSFASRAAFRLLWPPESVLGLVPQRQWRMRRVVQFAPETGLLRGGLPSLLLMGRRHAKLRVLLASMHSH